METTLYDKLQNSLKENMKAKASSNVLLLRGVIAKVKDESVNKGLPITDEIVLKCLEKTSKELEQSIMSFETAGRSDEVNKLKIDQTIISGYLPKPLTEDEINSIIADAIKLMIFDKGLTCDKRHMGLIMKTIKPKIFGKADGKLVSQLVNKQLTEIP